MIKRHAHIQRIATPGTDYSSQLGFDFEFYLPNIPMPIQTINTSTTETRTAPPTRNSLPAGIIERSSLGVGVNTAAGGLASGASGFGAGFQHPPRKCLDRQLGQSMASSLCKAAAAATSTKLEGGYLESFGATRTAPVLLAQFPGLQWLVLESPGPVPGESFEHLLEARKRALLALLARHCLSPGCPAGLGTSFETAAREGAGSVSGADFVLGLMAAATLPSDNAGFLTQVVDELTHEQVTPKTATRLRLLSADYRGIESAGMVKMGTLGLWADTCARLTGARTLDEISDPVIRALGMAYAGCSEMETSVRTSRVWQQELCRAAPTLLVISTQDVVVPASIQEGWESALCSPRVIRAREHYSKSGRVLRAEVRWIRATVGALQ